MIIDEPSSSQHYIIQWRHLSYCRHVLREQQFNHFQCLHSFQGHKSPSGISILGQSFQLCRQSWLCLLMSSNKFRCQVFLGCPHYQLSAYYILEAGFWRVWPMHHHHLWKISYSITFCLVCCHNSRFLFLSGQWISKILLSIYIGLDSFHVHRGSLYLSIIKQAIHHCVPLCWRSLSLVCS